MPRTPSSAGIRFDQSGRWSEERNGFGSGEFSGTIVVRAEVSTSRRLPENPSAKKQTRSLEALAIDAFW